MRNDSSEYVTAAKLIHGENAILLYRRRERREDGNYVVTRMTIEIGSDAPDIARVRELLHPVAVLSREIFEDAPHGSPRQIAGTFCSAPGGTSPRSFDDDVPSSSRSSSYFRFRGAAAQRCAGLVVKNSAFN